MRIEDLFNGFARCQLFKNKLNRDASTGDNRLSHHYSGIGYYQINFHVKVYYTTKAQGNMPLSFHYASNGTIQSDLMLTLLASHHIKPNGRNQDGTLNNVLHKVTDI